MVSKVEPEEVETAGEAEASTAREGEAEEAVHLKETEEEDGVQASQVSYIM